MDFKFQRLQFWLLEVLCLVPFFRVLLFVSNPSFLLKPFFVPFASVSEDPKSLGHGSPDMAPAATASWRAGLCLCFVHHELIFGGCAVTHSSRAAGGQPTSGSLRPFQAVCDSKSFQNNAKMLLTSVPMLTLALMGQKGW